MHGATIKKNSSEDVAENKRVSTRINGSGIRGCDEEWMFVRADTAHAEYP
jgi:hypothetical protein